MKMRFLCLVGLMLAATTGPVHAGMVISSNYVVARVNDYNGNNDAFDSYNGTSIPASHLMDATAGAFYARNQLDYTTSSSGTTINNQISLKRDGGKYDHAQAYDSSMYFTVTEDTTYDLSGFMNVTDNGAGSGRAYFLAFLTDQTAGQHLSYSRQESRNTNNESFVLGGSGGDYNNNNIGSLTGNLIAGRSYRFFAQALTQAYPDADSGASASAGFTLTLGSSAAVPEPASIAMWSLMGGIGIMVRRKCKRKATA